MAAPEQAPRILVVVPVYNHAASLRQVVEGILAQPGLRNQPGAIPLLVVDDGSSDGALGVLTGLQVATLQHAHNRGKGAALRSAAAWGLAQGYSHMICLDADGQHDPADLAQFFAAIDADPQALIVGHRDFDQASIPRSSRFGRQFSNFWLRLQTGQRLKDVQSGFRAYPLQLFAELNFWTERYNFEVEVLVRAAWAGLALRDVDISVYYPPAGERVSHFRGVLDNWRLTLLNTHLTLRSIVPWPHRRLSSAGETAKGESVSALHPLRSLRRLLSEHSSPRQLSASAALGVVFGTLPLLFCHTIAILFGCSFFRLNKPLAVSSSQLCMPPLVPALCIELGYFLRHGEWLTEFSLQTLGYQALQRFYDWLLGSLLLAPLLAILVGGMTLLLIELIKKKDAEIASP